MPTLFNRDQICTEQAAANARGEELMALANPNDQQKNEIAALGGKLSDLAQLRRMSDLLDRGDRSVLAASQRIGQSGRLHCVPVDFKLIRHKPTFALLGRNVGARCDHPALLLHYRTVNGSMLCIVDLRDGTTHGFAAENPPSLDDGPNADHAIFSEVITPITIGLNQALLWPLAVLLPGRGKSATGHDMSTTAGIRAAFYAWYRAHVPLRDGFIQWDGLNIGNLARLTWSAWWMDEIL